MPKCIVHGTVEGGRFVADFPSVFRQALNQFEGKRCSVSVDLFKRPRSLQQNKFLHGVVYRILADELDLHLDEVVYGMKAMFLPPRFIGKLDVPMIGTTTKLSTVEFEVYLEKIRAYAVIEHGIEIPVPTRGVDYE